MKRSRGSMVYAVAIPPEIYSRELFELVVELPNVEEIDLSGTTVTDQDLMILEPLLRLRGVGLYDTPVTDQGEAWLKQLPAMEQVLR